MDTQKGITSVTRFVLYHPEGRLGEGFPAFVCGVREGGEACTIYLLTRRTHIEVASERCRDLDVRKIRSGLIGVRAYEHLFGSGHVDSEEMIDSILHVKLLQGDEYSPFYPINTVRFEIPA